MQEGWAQQEVGQAQLGHAARTINNGVNLDQK